MLLTQVLVRLEALLRGLQTNFADLGTASVHEVIRGLGRLLRMGWKPLRTIVIASWDAEEVRP